MGSVTALGIKDTVLDLETQILYHLKGNHYPPVPAEMVAPCIDGSTCLRKLATFVPTPQL